jgi:hypothetical protein
MIEQYQNIKLKKVKRQQIEFVLFNEKLVKEITMKDLKMYDFIFFKVSDFLYGVKDGLKTTNIYGRITEIREKAIQINYTEWFPKSQIRNIYKKKEKIQTKLIKFYEVEKE